MVERKGRPKPLARDFSELSPEEVRSLANAMAKAGKAIDGKRRPAKEPVMVDLAKLDEQAVEAAAKEFLSYKGERPTRVTRRGAELWEDYTPAMRAAIAAYFKALRESSEKGR